MKASVILIGAPGVGKTKLGEGVANAQNFDFLDGDRTLIEYIRARGETFSSDPVAAKLEQLGDSGFLDFEHQFYMDRFPHGLNTPTRAANNSNIKHSGGIRREKGTGASAHSGVILSASGSMPLIPETVSHFKNTGSHFVWITRDAFRIVQNCKKRVDGVTRIVGIEKHGSLEAVITHRMKVYQNCADSILDL